MDVERYTTLKTEAESIDKMLEEQYARKYAIDNELAKMMAEEAFTSGILSTVDWSLRTSGDIQTCSTLYLSSRITPAIAKMFPGGWNHDNIDWCGLELVMDDNDLYLRGPASKMTEYIRANNLKVSIDDIQRQIDHASSIYNALIKLRDLVK